MAELPSGVVTFLVADLRRAGELWDRHPRTMPDILARIHEIDRTAVADHHGRVFEVVGDTLLAAFTSVGDGIGAAIDAQRALQEERWGVAVEVAMALHTAAVELRDGQYSGAPIIHALRVAGIAHGGQILLSRAAAERVLTQSVAERLRETMPPGVSLRDLGEERLQSLRRPDWIFQLLVPGLPDHFPPLRTPINRTRELARTVQELRALEEFSRVIGSTLDLEQVYAAIVQHATELTAADGCILFECDSAGRLFQLCAAHEMPERLIETISQPWGPGHASLLAQAALLRRPIQVPDILKESAFSFRSDPALLGPQSLGRNASFRLRNQVRAELAQMGSRALLAVPLLREDSIAGVLVTRRALPGRFQPETVDLIQAFAAQAVLAVQNARLFQQVQEKSHQLEVANRHKSEFLTNMSHELRTPLNAIIGFSEVLLERMFGDLNDKQDEYLRDILSSGRHLLSLINDILDLAKVEAGRMELDLGAVSLPEVLDYGVAMVREQAARHNITLRVTVSAAVGVIEADERKLKQVFLNLLSNAVKFTPDGGLVEATADRLEREIAISIRDTGVGIAEEDQERIFDEFRQVSAGHREGTGLGLTLTKQLVELHGGCITVVSRLGEGSLFTVTLPLRRPAPSEANASLV